MSFVGVVHVHPEQAVIDRFYVLVDEDEEVRGSGDLALLLEDLSESIETVPIHVIVHGEGSNIAAFIRRTAVDLRVLGLDSEGAGEQETLVGVFRSGRIGEIAAAPASGADELGLVVVGVEFPGQLKLFGVAQATNPLGFLLVPSPQRAILGEIADQQVKL